MRANPIISVAALLVALGAGALEGQDTDARRTRVQTQYTDTILSLRPPRSGFAAPEPTGFLELADADKRATVSGGWRMPRPGWPSLSATLEASTPLDDGDAPVSFGGHSGLSSGTTVKLSLTGARWTLRPVAPDSMRRWCENTQKRARDAGDVATLAGVQCGFAGPGQLERSMSDDLYSRYLRETGWTEPWIFDVNAGIGRTRFDYMDATTFTVGSDEKYGWSAGADVGRYQGRMLLSAGVHYKVEHRAASEADICLPVGGAGALRCRTSALGAPARTDSWTADVQMRRFFGRRGRLGVNPVVELDLRETELVARLPIYFLANESGALVGGITPSYSSHGAEHWGLDIFLGLKAPLAFGLR